VRRDSNSKCVVILKGSLCFEDGVKFVLYRFIGRRVTPDKHLFMLYSYFR
jgi:hypothetical protein